MGRGIVRLNRCWHAAFGLLLGCLLTSNALAAIGRTPGSHAVSPTGAFTYQIPLWVSPGAGGIQPNLTLSYDSQRGGGIMGPGWALTGLSAITRCNKTVAQDGAPGSVTLTLSDALCLDGKRLRLTSGTYGQSPSTYETEITDFTQVAGVGVSGNGPQWFIARAKNGLIYEFGNSVDSRISANPSDATIYMWLVNKVRDRAGNSYTVTYGTGAAGSVGIGVPERIDYSPSTAGGGTYINAVTFAYGPKVQEVPGTTDPAIVGYVGGTQVVNTNLLLTVNVYSNSNLVRRYSMDYEAAPTTTRARLASVTECASASDCLAPTMIGYQNGGLGVAAGSMAIPGGYFIGAPDVNGDGRDDMLYGDAGGAKVVLASGTGFGSPTIVTSSASFPLYGDISGSGQDDLLLLAGGTWTRYAWNGTGFVASGTAIAAPANFQKAALIDLNGDGRDDFVATTKTYNGSTRLYTLTVTVYLNTSTGGSVSFSAQPVYTKPVQCGPATATSPCDANIYVGQEAKSGSRSLDFNGDGRAELALTTLIPNVQAGESFGRLRFLRWNGSTFVEGLLINDAYDVAGFINWNDDACTDVILPGVGLMLSPCADVAPSFLGSVGAPRAIIDWNGDGRADVLVAYGSNFGVALSTGTGVTTVSDTGIPLADAFVFDQNGDGLQDLGTWSPAGIVFYPHAASGIKPDLVTSITDGFGVSASPTYVSIVNGNYTKGSGATHPERDYVGPLHVVSSLSATSGASDGSAATYVTSFWYYAARTDVTGRGFAGFDRVRMTDGRNGMIRDVYRRTAFPYTGMVYQDDLLQSDGSTLVSRTTVDNAASPLSSPAGNQRYFLYVDMATTIVREVNAGGGLNGSPIKTTTINPSFDGYGNATTVVTTVTDSFSGSPQYGQQWTSTVTHAISPDTSLNWCVNQPTSTTVTNTAPNVPTIVRTTAFVVDYVNCRVNDETLQPGDALWQVATNFRYDGFGNVDRVIVTPAAGQGQDPKTSYINWGSTGRHPETVTNALSQQTLIGWNHALGVRTSVTDPNGLRTTFQPDSFGRITRETRADGTATVFALTACDSTNSYCGSADLRSNVEITLRNASNGVLRTDSQQFDLFDRPRRSLQQLLGSAYSEVTRTYDVFGRVSAESIPHTPGSAAASVSYTYDLLGRTTRIRRPTSSSDPSNHDTTFAYQGLSVVQTDALNRNTTQRRNAIGLVAQSFDAAGSDTDYEYDAFGNLLKTRDVMGNEIVLTYNVRGMKMTSSDPDMGNWSYHYYPLGELKTQTDAKSQTTAFTYDALSRPRTRIETEGTTTWNWGATAANRNIGQLESVTSPGYSETYTYDSVGRPSRRRIVSDATYDYDYTYDAATGQLGTLTYPTSTSGYRLALQYIYQNAMPYQVTGGGTTYWQADAVNVLGQVTQETLGNGVVTTRALDAVTGLLSSIQSGLGGGAGLQNESYLFDKLGNLTQRQNNALGLNENFYYDTLSRLDYSTLGGVTNLDMSYDAIGNVTARSDIANGATWIYHGTKKHAVVQAGSHTYGYDPNGNATVRNGHQITWTSYNYPSVINGPNKNMTFSYGPNRERFRQIYNNGSATETTMYIGGALEKVTAGGVTDWRHSIVAGGKTVAIVSRKSDGMNATRYLLHDHQGSVANILNSDGTSFVSESFAAFGGRRDSSTWTGPCPCPDLQKIASVSRRGYTGHEMIGGHSMGLIHMNGRVQDSVTGRFLSADPFIQATHFSQSFNRYTYTLNNPLSLTDPTGFKTLTDNWITVYASGGWHSQSAVLVSADGTVTDLGARWVYEPGFVALGGSSAIDTLLWERDRSMREAEDILMSGAETILGAAAISATPSQASTGEPGELSATSVVAPSAGTCKPGAIDIGNKLAEISDALGTASSTLIIAGLGTTGAGLLTVQPEIVTAGVAVTEVGGIAGIGAGVLQVSAGVFQVYGGADSSNVWNGVSSLAFGRLIKFGIKGPAPTGFRSASQRAADKLANDSSTVVGGTYDVLSGNLGLGPEQLGCPH